MSSLVAAVFKATMGLLVDKRREAAAERLKEGDVTDQTFRGLIVQEMDDIKSKLDGLSRKDLKSSISFFKEEIEYLYNVFDKTRPKSESGSAAAQAATGTATAVNEALSLAKGVRRLELSGMDESATRALAKAKNRFESAREKATEAFNNDSLELSDRVTAMQYRAMATILETVDNPEDALPACRVCIDQLHSLPGVQKSFNVELKKGFLFRLSEDERWQIISTVCHVKRVMYNVLRMVARRGELLMLPRLDTGEGKIDPLRDERIAETLRKQGMEHCFVPWSFGQEGDLEHQSLTEPSGIAATEDGQFIIGDCGVLKIFDNSGKFKNFVCPKTDKELYVLDLATDASSNTYVLFRLKVPGDLDEWKVRVFRNNITGLQQSFAVKKGSVDWATLAVCDSNVLVLRRSEQYVVDVYEPTGQFVRSFGQGILKYEGDITATNTGLVMVLDIRHNCVHRFTIGGEHQ